MRCASRVAGGLVACAAVLPVVGVPTAGAAVSDLIDRPATVLSISPLENDMHDQLQGVVSPVPQTPVPRSLTLPSSPCWACPRFRTPSPQPSPHNLRRQDRRVRLQRMGRRWPGSGWQTAPRPTRTGPSPAALSFVVMGNPTRAFGGSGIACPERCGVADEAITR